MSTNTPQSGQTSKETLQVKMFNKLYLHSFNPANPSERLLKYLDNTTTNKSGYNGKYTEKKVSELPLRQLEYLVHSCKSVSSKIKQAASWQLYIRYCEDLDLNDTDMVEVFFELFKEELPDADIDALSISLGLTEAATKQLQNPEPEHQAIFEGIGTKSQSKPIDETPKIECPICLGKKVAFSKHKLCDKHKEGK